MHSTMQYLQHLVKHSPGTYFDIDRNLIKLFLDSDEHTDLHSLY